MKPEKLIDSVGLIDADLVERAEVHAAPVKHIRLPKWFAACAACLALCILCASAAYAAGLFNGLLSYFGGETESNWDEILSSVSSVSNDYMELRIDGAIADEYSCHMVVSFIGLTDEAKERFTVGSLDEQSRFDFYAVTKSGERVEFSVKESGTYTESSAFGGKKAKTMFEDVDMTYLLTGYLGKVIGMNDIEKVCFTFENLTLELNVQNHISPVMELLPENPTENSVVDFRISRIGFYFTVPSSADDFLDLKLIKTDGTLWVNEDGFGEPGFSAGADNSGSNTVTTWMGYWCGGSNVSVGIIDLEDFCGAQINGENYYFVSE